MKKYEKYLDEKILEEIPFFDGLLEEEKKKIFEGVEFYTVNIGDIVFESGDIADKLYILKEGKIKIYKNLLDGREQILYIYSSGDFVGGLNLLKDHEYRYIGEVIEKGMVVTLSKDKFDEIILENATILKKILEKSYDRIRLAEGLIDRLFNGTADGKVAGLLIDLADIFGKMTKEGLLLDFPISREEMASFAGTSRETVTRKIHQFKDLGYLELQGNKKILIKNLDRLEEISGEY